MDNSGDTTTGTIRQARLTLDLHLPTLQQVLMSMKSGQQMHLSIL
jgi:hypothetical protein